MSGLLVFVTLPPGVGFEGGDEVLSFFIGVGSIFSSPCDLGGRVQGVVKGGAVSRSSFCSTPRDGGGCWLTELPLAGEAVCRLWVIEADWDSPVLSIFLLLSLVVLERCGVLLGLGTFLTTIYASSGRRGQLLVGSPVVWDQVGATAQLLNFH